MAYKDPEKTKVYHRAYYNAHKEEVKADYQENKEEKKAYNKVYNKANEERIKVRNSIYNKTKRNTPEAKLRKRFNNIKHNYDLTQPEYDQMFREQNGVCAACGRLETREKNGKVVALSVDHDHKTGKIRGLLCSSCNFALGHVKEDVDTLGKLIAYLLRDLV